MYIIFTTSDKPMARLIRWATGEPVSHVALLIVDTYWGATVVHSTIKGVNIQPLNRFMDVNRILYTVPVKANPQALQALLNRTHGNPYDIGALLFAGVMLLCRRLLGLRSWPKQNLWQSSGMYMCTEFVTKYIDGEADSLITPYKLYERIKQV